MSQEIWKPVVGYESYYEVSNLGKIFSKFTNKEIIDRTDRYGYKFVKLRGKTNILSRIIAKAFIPNPEDKPCVNHKNGIKTDNRIENLEWCTLSENMAHAYNIGLKLPPMKGKKGYNHPSSIAVIQMTKDGVYINDFGSSRLAGCILGISQSQITACCKGKNKTAGGFTWKYK